MSLSPESTAFGGCFLYLLYRIRRIMSAYFWYPMILTKRKIYDIIKTC